MFKISILLAFLIVAPAQASTTQCPHLAGKYFCKGVVGSHNDMVMTINETIKDESLVYEYHYEQVDQLPITSLFYASDEGTPHPLDKKMVGKCADGYFFNSIGGALTANSYLNYINPSDEYEVIINNASRESYLKCPRVE